MREELEEREKKFAEYYVECGKSPEAARRAGYAESTSKYACNWLNPKKPKTYKPHVVRYIEELSAELKNERIMSAEERQIKLSEIARNKNHIEDTGDVIKAIDLLNKMTGEYLNKVEVNGSLNTQSDKLDKILEQLYDDE